MKAQNFALKDQEIRLLPISNFPSSHAFTQPLIPTDRMNGRKYALPPQLRDKPAVTKPCHDHRLITADERR
jgi:hypothetical protein